MKASKKQSKPQAPVVAPTELLAVLIDLCEAIDAYQSAREELQKCEDGSLDEQEAIDFALGKWKTVLELRKAVSANPKVLPLAGLGASREQPVIGMSVLENK